MPRLLRGLFLSFLAGSPAAWAARPFVSDDARITAKGSCQLESWVRQNRSSTEVWALPACQVVENLEVTFGAGRANMPGNGGATTDYVLQAKTLFRELNTDGWGIGLAIGTMRHPEINVGPNQLGNTYAYVPVSVSFAGDRLVMHANLGWLRDKASGDNQTTWGLGTEVNLHRRFTLIAESFGHDDVSPYWQAGVRFHVIPGLFQVDSSLGRQYGGTRDSQWMSLGVRLTPERLF